MKQKLIEFINEYPLPTVLFILGGFLLIPLVVVVFTIWIYIMTGFQIVNIDFPRGMGTFILTFLSIVPITLGGLIMEHMDRNKDEQ